MTTPSPAWKAPVLLAFFTLSAFPTGHASTSSAADAPAERVHRVESGLLPITATRSRLGRYANILDRMRAYGVPGISIAVINDGRLDWAKGYGVSDIATRTPVTPHTLFEGASISKPLAALGAMILVERGKLGLDTDVNDYLRQWRVPSNRMTQVHPVTLRTLLDHSAGLTDVAFPSYRPGEVAPTLAETLKTLSPAIRVETVPGRQYRYGATAFLVLQLLMEDVTNTPFPQYMQSQVFLPLHMRHSTFDEPLPATLLGSAAKGYYAGGVPVPGGHRFGPGSAASGLWTTPSDLARYITELQRAYAGTSGRLIDPAMARQMLSAQIAYRGLGVVLSGKGDDIRFGHDGFEYGFESAMVGYVHRGQGAVVMANSGFAYMLIKEVMGSIARAYRWPDYGSTNQWPPTAALTQQEVTRIPAGVLAAAPGRYAFDKSVSIEIYTDGSRLFLRYPDNGSAEIFRTPGGDFFCPQLTFSDFGDPRLRFELAKGKVQEVIASYGHLRLRRMN